MPTTTREIHLAARPHGEPVASDFKVVETTLPDPGPDFVLVHNLAMSVDPYMRGRMNDVPSYVPPFKLDEAMDGGAVGVVTASAADSLPVGTLVSHFAGWREDALLHKKQVQRIELLPGVPSSYFLGVLGMPGLTAYAGLFEVASFRAGDAVFVSSAAGAVGGLVGQFAKLSGASRVVGSAGSSEKVKHILDELEFDAAFDYHDGPVRKSLHTAAPDGIDVYFDNVGGEHLEAAIFSLRNHGRVALCGAISVYNATEPPAAPRNLSLAIGKRLNLRGFIVSDHNDLHPEFVQKVGGWLSSGQLKYHETIVDGLDNAVGGFQGLLAGHNTGKMIVRLAPDPA